MLIPPVKTLALLGLATAVANAAVVTYNWNITYVNTNPDGLMDRRVIGINGQFPCVSSLFVQLQCRCIRRLFSTLSNHFFLHSSPLHVDLRRLM
jgi:iron transport multicopper oxidase